MMLLQGVNPVLFLIVLHHVKMVVEKRNAREDVKNKLCFNITYFYDVIRMLLWYYYCIFMIVLFKLCYHVCQEYYSAP